MLQVDIEKIIPVTEARDMFNKIVDEVEGTEEMYVLTKNGKPSAVIVGVNHLEKLTGAEGSEVMAKISDLNEAEAAVPETEPTAAVEEPAAPDAFSEPVPAEPSPAPAQDFAANQPLPEQPATVEPAPVEPAQTEPTVPNIPPVEPMPATLAPDPFATPAPDANIAQNPNSNPASQTPPASNQF